MDKNLGFPFWRNTLKLLMEATDSDVVKNEIITPLKLEFEKVANKISNSNSMINYEELLQVTKKIEIEYRAAYQKQHGHPMRYG